MTGLIISVTWGNDFPLPFASARGKHRHLQSIKGSLKMLMLYLHCDILWFNPRSSCCVMYEGFKGPFSEISATSPIQQM